MEIRFSVSPEAQGQLIRLQQKSGEALVLRISVDAGGCSGLKYQLDLGKVTDLSDGDLNLAEFGQVVVVTDDVSLPFLMGAELDYEVALMESSFVVKNPQAKTSCGCGASFSMF